MKLDTIGKNIRKFRLARKLRQEDLAEKTDLTTNYIGMVERGEKIPSLETFIKIVNAYEKKYIELTEEDRAKVTSVYHNWQQEGYEETYENVPEFCYSASFEEVKEKGFTLVPSRYIEFVNRDENIDFDTKMKSLQGELKELLVQEEKSKSDLLAVFKELGYEIEL